MVLHENIKIEKSSTLNIIKNNNHYTKLGASGLNIFLKNLFKKNQINLYKNKKIRKLKNKKLFINNVFINTLTVTISKILSNGNFIIIGEKKIFINNHKEYLHVSGIVDPKNINKKKIINSAQVANLNIKYFKSKKKYSKKYTWFKKFFYFLKK
ncbi:flagellar basal body L-ring protein FlgH [Buchnera aphidicola]|uniref:flagellar basal body L-ring protein FlgH n=1 Tax=Buchnera aphidicola TaxID=9 RepID=UPI0031B829A0